MGQKLVEGILRRGKFRLPARLWARSEGAMEAAKRSRGGVTRVIQEHVHYSAYIAHRLLEVRSEAIQLSIPVGEQRGI